MTIDTTIPILIGGPSGVGKSSIISNIIKQSNSFIRPKSYTTRTQRNNEDNSEYIFVSETEYNKLKNRSAFINDDYVYGNFYATSRHSVEEIIKDKKFPIKEIYPNNFKKFKTLYPNLITVIILPNSFNDIKTTDIKRYKEDMTFFKNLDISSYDIILYNDFHFPIEEIARYLIQTIKSIAYNINSFPRPEQIDILNKKGYNLVAKEFNDSKRLTTRDFHRVSIPFFEKSIKEYVKPNDKILEIGPGSFWLTNTFTFPEVHYHAVDISDKMKCNTKNLYKVKSIRNTRYNFNEFDVILASLADPYFYPAAICEMWRILKPNGYIILTTPSSKWSEELREDKQKTKFVLENNKTVEVYSFTFTKEQIISILSNCNFIIEQIEEIPAKSLALYDDISPILTTASKLKNKDIKELILLNCIILRKHG